MTGTGPYANSSAQLAMAIETTRGTAAATPVYWIPVTGPKIIPVLTVVQNASEMGAPVAAIDQLITARHDELTFTCFAYVDTVMALVRGLLGSPDTITGTTANKTHVLSLLCNDPSNGNQPPSYTFFLADGQGVRTLPGGMVDELSVKFTATGLVELTVKVQAFPYVFNSTIPSSAYTTVAAAPAWAATSSLNSVTTTPIVDGTLSFKRNVTFPQALGSVSPYVIFSTKLDTSGCSLTVINRGGDTEQNLGLAGTKFPLTLTFSPPTSAGMSFQFQMSSVGITATNLDEGADGMVIASLTFEALPNATDATAGLISPVKVTAITAQATTY